MTGTPMEIIAFITILGLSPVCSSVFWTILVYFIMYFVLFSF